ncbi:MAG: hypothetical protein WCA79_02705 [Anaerolineales bacterium]
MITILIQTSFWGALIGLIVAAYLANVSFPKEGAIVGAIIVIPDGVRHFVQAAIQLRYLDKHGLLATLLVFLVGAMLVSGIGAVNGLIIGKLFQTGKKKNQNL